MTLWEYFDKRTCCFVFRYDIITLCYEKYQNQTQGINSHCRRVLHSSIFYTILKSFFRCI